MLEVRSSDHYPRQWGIADRLQYQVFKVLIMMVIIDVSFLATSVRALRDVRTDHEGPSLPSVVVETFPNTTAYDVDRPITINEGSKYIIKCNVTIGGLLASTEWFIQRPHIDSSIKHIGISPNTGAVAYPIGLADQVVISGHFLNKPVANEFHIENFTRPFHMSKLQCGTENYETRGRFILGIEG